MPLKETAKRLAFISVLFIIVFNFPFVAVFNSAQSFLGVPVLYLFLFTAWLVFITVLILFMRKNMNSDKE